MATRQMKTWDVHVRRIGGSIELGQVHEVSEELARCAALHKFGVGDADAEEGASSAGIRPADDFDVWPA